VKKHTLYFIERLHVCSGATGKSKKELSVRRFAFLELLNDCIHAVVQRTKVKKNCQCAVLPRLCDKMTAYMQWCNGQK
jgi:hypothetical protein